MTTITGQTTSYRPVQAAANQTQSPPANSKAGTAVTVGRAGGNEKDRVDLTHAARQAALLRESSPAGNDLPEPLDLDGVNLGPGESHDILDKVNLGPQGNHDILDKVNLDPDRPVDILDGVNLSPVFIDEKTA